MNQKLKHIIKSFNITDQVLKERREVGLYIESLSFLIVDRFYDYLLSNPDFSKLINRSELPRLKRIKTQFIISLFNDEFNYKLLENFSQSHKNYPFKVDSYIIASEFEIMNQTIIDISSVNDQLKRHLKTILKFIHIAEFIVQDNFSKYSSIQKKESKIDLTTVLETLFKMLSVHKNKHQYLLKSWHDKNLNKQDVDKLPAGNVEECQFSDTLHNTKKQFTHIKEFNIDITHIDLLHKDYHTAVKVLYDLIEANSSLDDQKSQIQNIENISENLFEYISKPFENSASLTFLTVNSGMRFIQKYASVINETKFIPYNDSEKIIQFIKNLIEESLKNPLSWAIESYDVNKDGNLDNCDIGEQIILNCATIYISLKIKSLPYNTFILDIIKIFLEILKISLINREKEYTLTALADKAETANRSKDIFLANMSHELRTPLNAIIGFSQVLQMRQEIPENMRTYIEKISIAGNNLLDLVNTILDFAKLEAGKISYHPQTTLLSELLKEVLIIISPLAEAKNITLKFPSDISLTLYIDQQLIKQAFINILSNAIKFTPENGKVTLSIDFNKELKEYIISICDTGVGMTKEALSLLFTPFTQIENSLQSDSKGTGLGLVITKRIVEDLHGGRIWVESEVNQGSCFHIAVPITTEQSKVEIFSSKNNNKKLLIVEDNEEYVDILVNKLNNYFNITVTNSINKAKELLEHNDYDKIILDFFLIDGISSEVLYFMEQEHINTPVYIISAEDDYKIVEHIQESKNIVGVFNKTDIEMICDTLIRVENG